ILQTSPSYVFPISVAHPRFLPILEKCIAKSGISTDKFFFVSFEKRYDLMRHIRCALAKSGTVTLELALHRVPTVVTYSVSKLDQWIVRYILRIRMTYYCLVNILLNKEVFPEWIGDRFD